MKTNIVQRFVKIQLKFEVNYKYSYFLWLTLSPINKKLVTFSATGSVSMAVFKKLCHFFFFFEFEFFSLVVSLGVFFSTIRPPVTV